jgi:shikimate dehydrogenase
MITGHAALAGIVGWPVAHSRSPILHNAWLARHGIDGAYVPLAVAPDDFARAIEGLAASGFRGVNVTIPHKQAAFAVCAEVDDDARRAGAVNTLVFGAQGVRGSNTDGRGFLANLAAHGVDPAAGPALLCRRGGARDCRIADAGRLHRHGRQPHPGARRRAGQRATRPALPGLGRS